MWAVVVEVDIRDVSEATKELKEQVVPMVREAPGFVAGYWIRLDDNHGTSFVVFESEGQARAGAPSEGMDSPGVTMTSVKIGEVIEHA
jgi:hypothetical protein